jgi:hypothetical protein
MTDDLTQVRRELTAARRRCNAALVLALVVTAAHAYQWLHRPSVLRVGTAERHATLSAEGLVLTVNGVDRLALSSSPSWGPLAIRDSAGNLSVQLSDEGSGPFLRLQRTERNGARNFVLVKATTPQSFLLLNDHEATPRALMSDTLDAAQFAPRRLIQ